MIFLHITSLFLLLFCFGCHHETSVQSIKATESAATQKRIVVGMTEPAVAHLLGMPNLATKDARGKNAWVYERYASEVAFSPLEGGSWLINAYFGNNSNTPQKVLTVVIKFGPDNTVDDVTYHSNQF